MDKHELVRRIKEIDPKAVVSPGMARDHLEAELEMAKFRSEYTNLFMCVTTFLPTPDGTWAPDPKPGDRVGVVAGIGKDGDDGWVLGFGVYECDEVPGEAAIGVAASSRMLDMRAPRIVLDNGDVVWGPEAYWGPEETIRNLLEGWAQQGLLHVQVSVEEYRQGRRDVA